MKTVVIIFGLIGILYGLCTGIPLGMYFVARMLIKKNTVSKGDDVSFSYSSRGVEVIGRSVAEEYVPLGSKKKKLSDEAKEYREDLDYFKRNII
jgi:hypothetical protein